MSTTPATVSVPQPLTAGKLLFLATGLAGTFLVSLSTQFGQTLVPDMQGNLAATPDEASWILTVYTMASFVGVITAGVLIRTLSIGRYITFSATLFGLAAFGSAIASDLALVTVLRALQGLAAGGFGPAAFIAVFMTTGGPRLPFGLMLLGFFLVFPSTLGPVVAGLFEEAFSWRGVFLLQAAMGVGLASAARAWMPRNPIDRSALKTDWVAIALLSIAAAALMLVLSQGARRFWFESPIIVWASAAGLSALAGFIFVAIFSPRPIFSPRLLATRHFGIAVLLTLVFRFGVVVITYLVPQFLAVVQGYRPLEIAGLMLWAVIPQLLVLPLAWWLMRQVDLRAVMALGLLLCGFGTALAIDGSVITAADQFHLTLAIFGVGQVLFLVPVLVAGGGILTPADGPTASLAFNLANLGGSTMGTGLVTHLVTEREKFHSNVLVEKVSLFQVLDAERLTRMTDTFASRVADDAAATAQALVQLASSTRRQAWALSFNDGFLVVAVILVLSALGVLAMSRPAPITSSPRS